MCSLVETSWRSHLHSLQLRSSASKKVTFGVKQTQQNNDALRTCVCSRCGDGDTDGCRGASLISGGDPLTVRRSSALPLSQQPCRDRLNAIHRVPVHSSWTLWMVQRSRSYISTVSACSNQKTFTWILQQFCFFFGKIKNGGVFFVFIFKYLN